MNLMVALLAVQLAGPECASRLTLRGVGADAATRVKPYVACLNSTVGTQEQIRASCSEARAGAKNGSDKTGKKAKLDRAMNWLDAMIRERSLCETHLDVEA